MRNWFVVPLSLVGLLALSASSYAGLEGDAMGQREVFAENADASGDTGSPAVNAGDGAKAVPSLSVAPATTDKKSGGDVPRPSITSNGHFWGDLGYGIGRIAGAAAFMVTAFGLVITSPLFLLAGGAMVANGARQAWNYASQASSKGEGSGRILFTAVVGLLDGMVRTFPDAGAAVGQAVGNFLENKLRR